MASFKLPTNLDSSERTTIAKIVGFGSASRLMTPPTPLGGYEGFQMGLATDQIATAAISKLGSTTKEYGSVNYNSLFVGKGFYQNFDLFLHFTPLGQSEEINNFGLQLRWGFYEFPLLPMSLGFVLHGSGSNYLNLLNARTSGVDFVVNYVFDEIKLYAGGGRIRSLTAFTGGNTGVTKEGTTQEVDLLDYRLFSGISFHFGKMFLHVQADRIYELNYSARLGVTF